MAIANRNEYTIRLPRPFGAQRAFIDSPAKRKIIRAGRRSGKTTGVSVLAVEAFLKELRCLYATPTALQLGRFWFEITEALAEPISSGYLRKNEVEHSVTLPHTNISIQAKTAWNADMFRGDFADLLIYDEWQLMNEDAWGKVGAPMLMDNDGDAVFVYTPPSIASRSTSKATDPMHAAKMFKRALADTTGRWETFHFTSHDNPFISQEALANITLDMTSFAHRQEILALDLEDNPAALWERSWIDRVTDVPDLYRILVAVDPTGSSGGDECGIVGGGAAMIDGLPHLFLLEDASLHGTADEWAQAAVALYHKLGADRLVAEKNFGGDMVESVLRTVDPNIRIDLVHASRGKQIRAEPISAAYEQGRCHHVGFFPYLEDEMCQWQPGFLSPNRLDALVWLATPLVGDPVPLPMKDVPQPEARPSTWDPFNDLNDRAQRQGVQW